MDNTAAQRFDSTEFSERKPFRKFDAVEPPFAVLIVGKRSGSIAPTFSLKGLLSEYSLCYRTTLRCCQYLHWITQQHNGSIAPHFLKPFKKFGSIEPPFIVLIVGNRSGLVAPLENFRCHRTAVLCCQYLQWITQQRSGSIAPTVIPYRLKMLKTHFRTNYFQILSPSSRTC